MVICDVCKKEILLTQYKVYDNEGRKVMHKNCSLQYFKNKKETNLESMFTVVTEPQNSIEEIKQIIAKLDEQDREELCYQLKVYSKAQTVEICGEEAVERLVIALEEAEKKLIEKERLNMDKNYLLTYECPRNEYNTFAWFKTEEELREFIIEINVNPIKAFKIINAEELEI